MVLRRLVVGSFVVCAMIAIAAILSVFHAHAVKRNSLQSMASVREVVEFHRLFPRRNEVVGGIQGRSATWTASACVDESYVIMASIDIELTWLLGGVASWKEIEWQVSEVRGISANQVHFNPAAERQFGAREWARFVASGGDLRSVGIEPHGSRFPGLSDLLMRPSE